MTKLTQKQIENIKALRQEGEPIEKLVKKFNVNRSVIYWHTSPLYREKIRAYRRKYRKNNKKYYESQREYQKNYHKNRYQSDSEFKRKQLERMKLKGGQG